jgi:DNA-binding MarR family transcriptional regulator
MGEVLRKRLKTTKFENPQHEAVLSLLIAASHVRSVTDKVAAKVGISTEQYNILRILKGAYPKGHACGEIGNRMIDRSPDITRRIDALEKAGYVERMRSEDDRRVVITRITEKGIALLGEVNPLLVLAEEGRSKKLTDAEATELTRICEKLFEDDVDCEGH